MAINSTQSNGQTTFVRYSAFLGMLYVSNQATEALIKEAKSLVGEEEVKKGYKGYKGDTSSAKARNFLAERDIKPIAMSGVLTSANVIEREKDGRKSPYLTVYLKDDGGRYVLSIDLGQPAAQMLARKLDKAEIGVETEINLFATYGQREGATRAYADHGASLRQAGREVIGLDPRINLAPRIEVALKALADAGVSKEDKETMNKRRATVERDFHSELMQGVKDRVTAFYAATGLPSDSNESDGQDEEARSDSQRELSIAD